MASLDNKELAYTNAIQIIKALTMAGFVPNYSSGLYKSRDRTEPCIGVKVVHTLYNRFKDRWFLELLYPDLLAWNTCVRDIMTASCGEVSGGDMLTPVLRVMTAGSGTTAATIKRPGLLCSAATRTSPSRRRM